MPIGPTDQEKQALFDEVALPHLTSLYYAALRLSGNQMDVEDLVQETFSRAYCQVGFLAPDFQVPQVRRPTPLRLSDLRGQPVWLYFWATWCTYCRAEMPAMERTYAVYQGTPPSKICPPGSI